MTTNRAARRLLALALGLSWAAFPGPALGAQTGGFSAAGVASWYGADFHGRRTSSGEVYDRGKYSAAHRSLPFGTLLLVTLESTGKQVVVRVNDRGPFVAGRIIDLSEAAAAAIGLDALGVGRVTIAEVKDFPVGPLPGAATAPGKAAVAGAAAAPSQARPSPAARDAWCDIQVASFSKKENADAAVARLSAVGYSPEIRTVPGFYRVVLAGLPADRAEAERKRLEDLGYPRVLVTLRQIAKDR